MLEFLGGVGAQTIATLGIAIAVGLAVGQIKVCGISLGVSGVLFSGIAMGHLGFSLDAEVLAFISDFGLILFIFAVGLQVGPGFTDSLRRGGLLLNGLAAGAVGLEALVAVLLVIFLNEPASALIGLFSGATTSTPALAAASQTMAELGVADLANQIRNLGMGYAISYPFGVVGVILAMYITRYTSGVNIGVERQALEDLLRRQHPVMSIRNLQVTNANLFGKPLSFIPGLEDMGVTISRVMEEGKVFPASPDTPMHEGMLVHVVGEAVQLDRASLIIGPEVETELQASHGQLEIRYLLVSNASALGKTLQNLHLTAEHGITVTRIRRAGMELAPRQFLTLHIGDKIVCVGQKNNLDRAEKVLGNSTKAFDQPHVLPIFVGIVLGVVVGSVPIALPGLSAAFKLGLAGGPLLIAILLSRVEHFAGMTWYLPSSSGMLMREMGISLFLACVGLGAGEHFLEAVLGETGLLWLGIGACITLVPLLIIGWVARVMFKLNFITICGLYVGLMNSAPTLAFATNMLDSDVPSSVYATVYPLSLILRLVVAQAFVLALYT